MKSILIAAVMAGAAVAGLILYMEKKVRSSNRVLDAADDAYKTANKGTGNLDRPAYHAMG